jgi:integrase
LEHRAATDTRRTSLFASYAIPGGWQPGQDAAYWIPIIGVFTGARVSELAQLRVVDAETVDGVAVLRITDEADGSSVKTEAGRRVVPVHEELIRLGFLDYVAAIRTAGSVSLWPALRLLRGKPGNYFSGWFSDALRKVDEQTKLPDFHSLRHTVRSRLASAGVAEPMIDALIGHEVKGSTGARTYTHRTTADLKAAIDRLTYPGVPLPRVFKAPAGKPTK